MGKLRLLLKKPGIKSKAMKSRSRFLYSKYQQATGMQLTYKLQGDQSLPDCLFLRVKTFLGVSEKK